MLSNEVKRLEVENEKLRAAIESLQTEYKENPVKPKACEHCQFYIQHYVKVDRRYIATYCGHCTHGRVKDRKPKDSCKYFEIGTYETKYYAERSNECR